MSRSELVDLLSEIGDVGIERFVLWCEAQSSLVFGPWRRLERGPAPTLTWRTRGELASSDMVWHYQNAYLETAKSTHDPYTQGYLDSAIMAGERFAMSMQRLWLEDYIRGFGCHGANNTGGLGEVVQ